MRCEEEMSEKGYETEPYRYTDDVLGGFLIVAYVLQGTYNLVVPEWALAACLVWLFGKGTIKVLKDKFKVEAR